MSKNVNPHLDRRLTNSIKDDLRLDLLRIFSERSATPRELAEIFDEDPNDVLDRVIELWANGCVEVVEEGEPCGDAIDRRYCKAPPFFVDDRKAHELTRAEREKLSAAVLQEILTETLGALRSGSLDARPDMHLSYKALRLDEDGWREFMALLLRTLKEVEAIEESCRDRLGLSGGRGIEGVVALMGFERSESRGG